MTAVVWWTIAGVAVGTLAPAVLRVMVRRGVDAAVVLAVWAVAVCATLIAVALPALAELVHRCWLALHSGPPGRVDSIAGILSAAAIAVVVLRGGWQLRCTGRQRRRLHERHVELAWLLTGAGPQPGSVLWLPAAQPLAYSLAGNPSLIVVTNGLRQCLDRSAVSAVLAHERAHLQRRHHLVIGIAAAAAAGMGWLPLMRHSPALVRTLVELDADAHAARRHGSRGLRRALQVLGAMPAPSAALAIAGGECTKLRLARLDSHQSGAAARLAGSPAAVCGAALVLSVVAFLGFVALTALSSCAAV